MLREVKEAAPGHTAMMVKIQSQVALMQKGILVSAEKWPTARRLTACRSRQCLLLFLLKGQLEISGLRTVGESESWWPLPS